MITTLATHQAFGLNLASDLPMPELLPAAQDAVADAVIHLAAVPAQLEDAIARGVRYQSAPGRLLLAVDGVARYLISAGREIIYQPAPDATPDDIRVFLLGSALGALLHQRNDLVLHAGAVVIDGAAVAFMGKSGAGKSTLSSALRLRGHPLLTDDLCVIRPGPGGALLAHPGFPQAKLWLDSLDRLELPAEGLRRIRHKLEKRAVPLSPGEGFHPEAVPVRKLYLLRPRNEPGIEIRPVVGPAKFLALKEQTYRFQFMADADSRTGHFHHALRLAQETPLATVARSRGEFLIEELADRIEADLRTAP